MNIAVQNSVVNSGMMEARYEYKRPVTLQILFNRQLSERLSIEMGLNYTRLASTISTGSSNAYIQEEQRIRYLGIPIRLGWQWYSIPHLSLYSSAGVIFEWPIKSRVDISHIANGIKTFQKETSLDVPCQWSMNFGLGLQYDYTPYIGIYLEPNLLYFFDDGSNIKTYRSEHPLQVALPIGLRFRW
jgi:RNA polymerase sigma-70 factor (ECF subfamily)